MRQYHFTGREADEDFYLIPIKLNKEILLVELQEIIDVFYDGNFISYKQTSGFSAMFFHMFEGLKIYCDDHRDDGKGREVCKVLIELLNSLDTDDDYFPKYEINLIEEIKNLCN
jgi:hypothetical protein